MRKFLFLTNKQRAVFNFVRQRIYNGMPPTQREISEHIGVFGRVAGVSRKI